MADYILAALRLLENVTPLDADCGELCNHACCKGDNETGMILFPGEKTSLPVKNLSNDMKLAICDGTCERCMRPLSCRIFPFFPCVDKNGNIFVALDYRGKDICPMIKNSDMIRFNRLFLRRVKVVGRILSKDPKCLEFMKNVTKEIELYGGVLK